MEEKKKKKRLGCGGLFLYSIPFILIAWGILMQVLAIHSAHEVDRATAQTIATVISEENREETDTSRDWDDPDRYYTQRYITLTFTIDGEQRWKTGKNDELKVGEEVIAWYDPDDTEIVYIEGYDDFGGGLSFLSMIPLALGVGMLILYFVIISKDKKKTAQGTDTTIPAEAEVPKPEPHLYYAGNLSDEEIAALKYKMLNPGKTVICPRCGSEIILKEHGVTHEVRCSRRSCIRGQYSPTK